MNDDNKVKLSEKISHNFRKKWLVSRNTIISYNSYILCWILLFISFFRFS